MYYPESYRSQPSSTEKSNSDENLNLRTDGNDQESYDVEIVDESFEE